MTDIEGNHDYWCRFIAHSKVLCGASGDIDFRDGRGQLVFGGDICDRGPGLIYSFFACYISSLLIH